MFKSQDSIIIHRPGEYVFKVAETYPLFVTFFRSREILYQDDKTMKVRIGSNILGIPTSWIGEGKKRRFDSIEFTQTEGFFKGLVAIWSFRGTGESTVVTINITFKIDFPWIGRFFERFLGTMKVRRTVRGILKELKREAEEKFS